MPLLDRLETAGTTLTPLKGNQPTAPLQSGAIPINNSFQDGTYQNTLSDSPRSTDNTGNA
tara:strand:+ start:1759 stop:1938 length:180 start_codon:yes stop_codon:yes gene_type:complete